MNTDISDTNDIIFKIFLRQNRFSLNFLVLLTPETMVKRKNISVTSQYSYFLEVYFQIWNSDNLKSLCNIIKIKLNIKVKS